MITRRRSLGLLGAACAVAPLGTTAFAQARLSYDLNPKQVAQGAWMVEGSTDYFTMENGGAIVNCAVLQGDSGLIVVDTGPSLRYGEALARAARALDLRGVSAVINTHHHPDHYFGNQAFATVPSFALGETLALAQRDGDGFADNMYRILGDWMRGTEPLAPQRVIEGGRQSVDGRALTVLPLAGHTSADMALLDEATGLLIAGDLVFYNRAATTPSADLTQWLLSLDILAQQSAAAILPGHGPLDQTGAAIAQTRGYLTWLRDTLTDAAQNGFDMIEIMQMPLPDQYAALGAQPEEFRRSVAHLFPEIELSVLPRAN